MILVDATKFISWMRTGRSPIVELSSALRSRSLISCGIVRIEVLRGMIKPKAKAQIAELLAAIPEIPIDDRIIGDAADTAWALDRVGRVLPVTDLLIAACAKRAGATVITEDPYFEQIPDLVVAADLP